MPRLNPRAVFQIAFFHLHCITLQCSTVIVWCNNFDMASVGSATQNAVVSISAICKHTVKTVKMTD